MHTADEVEHECLQRAVRLIARKRADLRCPLPESNPAAMPPIGQPLPRLRPLQHVDRRANLRGVQIRDALHSLHIDGERGIGEAAEWNLSDIADAGVHRLDLFHRGMPGLDEGLLRIGIGRLIEEHGIRPLAIAPGPARLLVVRLQRRRQIDMHHKPHIRLVNAHSKRIRGYDHTHLVLNPLLLRISATPGIHAPMIPRCRNPLVLQPVGPHLHVAPSRRIHDAASGHTVQHVAQLVALVGRLKDRPHQIWTIKALHDDLRVLQVEQVLHVGAHLGGCCCRNRQHGRITKRLASRGDLFVVGAEMMPPLTYAVRLVHRQQRHVQFRRTGLKVRGR